MEIDKLKKFGEILTQEVRDRAMGEMEVRMGKDFSIIGSHEKDLYKKLCLTAIDETIFKFFVMLEENQDEINLVYQNDILVDISDGLGGDYLGDWIEDYSKYKSVI